MEIQRTMTSPGRTVHQWASYARQRGIQNYGEKEFATLVLRFDREIDSGSDLDNVSRVLNILAESDNAYLLELAIIWMDGAGFGGKLVKDLLN